MRTQRMMIASIAVITMAALLWQARATAQTLGEYQPPVVRQAQWALQRENPERALALLESRTAELRRWRAQAQGEALVCQAYFQIGDYTRAEQACDRAFLATGEENAQYLHNRGVMRLLLGRVIDGVTDLKKVSAMSAQIPVETGGFAVARR